MSTFSLSRFLSVACLAIASLCPALAALPDGLPLLPTGFGAFKPLNANDPPAMVQEVPVTGQPFKTALRIDTYGRQPGVGQHGLQARVGSAVKKGDVLWISFKARRLQSQRETGEASFTLRFDQLVNGKFQWPSHLERGISVGGDWTDTHVPFVMEKDAGIDEVQLVLQFDTYEQRYEIGPVTFTNYGRQVSTAQLPRSVVRYGGDDAAAPWRKAAAERIEQLRKGDLVVQVVDAAGKPVTGADVAVRMTRNAFHWGTAVNSANILGTDADAARYRENLAKYFNQAVFENEVKAKYWGRQDPNAKGEKIKAASRWLRERGFGLRGHVMAWPSWQHSPHLVGYRGKPDAVSALRQRIRDDIADMTGVLGGVFDEWDVLNEPYAHHEVLDLLGKPEAIEWFKAARAGAPRTQLFLNDYTMFQGEAASESFFAMARYLKEQGAPIDAIGEQGHIGGTPPDIPLVLQRLDRFAELGLPIHITEFDINSNDDDYKARYLADFMTAVYSHPATRGFVQWGFWEGAHWFPVAAMWNRDWSIRKHGQAYVDLVTKTWWTDASGRTTADGRFKLRGFTGDYEISVTHEGRVVKKTLALDKQGATLVVTH